MSDASNGQVTKQWLSLETIIAILAIIGIAVHIATWLSSSDHWLLLGNIALYCVLAFGGVPLVWGLLVKLARREFGSDLLAGLSIVTSILLGEYLAGAIVVLMLSGGEALEAYAVRSASSVLNALSKRMPSIAHRKTGATMEEVGLDELAIGDIVVVLPHEVCPIDGTVVEGHGAMDESYLTGEPYSMSKVPGASVLSGAINGQAALVIQADKLAVDSRYAKIMKVMEASEQQKPQMRRLADRLGAWYTPVAVGLGLLAWLVSGDPVRFLAVLVVATPCPLLIAIPVAIIGSISLAARRAIIIRDPTALETADTCKTLIFDKTGTLTYGQPKLVEQIVVDQNVAEQGVAEQGVAEQGVAEQGVAEQGVAEQGVAEQGVAEQGGRRTPNPQTVLGLVAGLEQYSKHPLARAILNAADSAGLPSYNVSAVNEAPGRGLQGTVDQHHVEVTSRHKLLKQHPDWESQLPPLAGGLECVILVDGSYAATYRFRDAPRRDSASFISHLSPQHAIERTMMISGDRESEVRYLAEQVGIDEVYFSQSPEQKLALVNQETQRVNTMYVGDGINDAPALMAATVGIAFGQNSDVTAEAADVVVLDSSLRKIDEFMHISRRMRRIALQSALGGMILSVLGMGFAAAGYLSPVAGAICQELIDIAAVLNALRVALPQAALIDFDAAD